MYTPGIWSLHGRGGTHLNPSMEEIQQMMETIDQLEELYKDTMEIKPLNLSWFREYKKSRVPACSALEFSCVILENGLIIPCEMLADFSHEFAIGNVKNQSLFDIWNSEKANKWVSRENVKIGGPCPTCSEFKRCRGGCPWKSIVAYGEWAGDPSCEKTSDPINISLTEIPQNKYTPPQ